MTKQKRTGDRYLELHAQGLTNAEIARACGMSPQTVTSFFQKKGIARNKPKPTSKHEKALRQAQRRKLTYQQAAQVMGLSQAYVSATCKRLGIKLVDGRSFGNRRGK